MSRYRSSYPRDESSAPDGDSGFAGVNMRLHPSQLPQGIAAYAENTRFRDGIPRPRGGAVKVPWLNRIDWQNDPSRVLSWEDVHGVGTFSDPDEHEWTILAAGGGVYKCADSHGPNSLRLPVQTTIDYPVEFIQAFGQLLMLRGEQLNPLVLSSVDEGWTVAMQGLSNFSFTAGYSLNDQVLFPPVPAVAWNDADTYAAGDLVSFEGKWWLANQNVGADESPADEPTKWDDITYDAGESYALGAGVVFQSTRFTALVDVDPAETPLSAPEKWQRMEHHLYFATATAAAGQSPVTQPTKWTASRSWLPAARTGLYIQNRLVLVQGRDVLLVSDALDINLYQEVSANIRLNKGTADAVVRLEKFNDFTVIVFKETSVLALENLYGDLADARLNELVNGYGLAAKDAVAAIGSDLWFLSQRGVVSLRQTEQNKLHAVDNPISDAIQPLMDRVNWHYASGATAAYWDNKFYLALPLDRARRVDELFPATPANWPSGEINISGIEVGKLYYAGWSANTFLVANGGSGANPRVVNGLFTAQETEGATYFSGAEGEPIDRTVVTLYPVDSERFGNNAIVVFDLLNQQWSGVDTGAAIHAKQFFTAKYNGKLRLCFSGLDGFNHLYEEGDTDFVYTAGTMVHRSIATLLRTRAYGTGFGLGPHHWNRLELQLATWSPTFTVKALYPGIGEDQTVFAGKTRSRTRYIKPFDRANYVASNINDDFSVPHREDYSVLPGVYLGNGVQLGRHQMENYRQRLRGYDRTVQVELRNTTGSVHLHAVKVEAQDGTRKDKQ